VRANASRKPSNDAVLR